MKVLHLIAGGDAGGAETYFTETVVALAQAGLEQTVLMRKHPEREAKLKAAAVKVETAPFGGLFDHTTPRKLDYVIEEFQPKIIQAWMGRAASYLPRHSRAIKVGWFGGYYKLKRFRNADHFVGVSYDIARYIVSCGVAAEMVHTIHTFADLDILPPPERSEFDTPEDVPLLLFLGRLHEKKGVDIALQALMELPDCWLWIAGDGALRNRLQNLAKKLGITERVRFLGWREDRGALLRAADILLVPSRYEPFGTVMVEAWGTGTPLIAAAAAGPAAYLKNNQNGLLIPIDDPNALAFAVTNILENKTLRETIIAGGSDTYQSFTKKHIVKAYLEFYETISRKEPTQGRNKSKD